MQALIRFSKSLNGRLAAYFALAITVSLLISAFISVGLVRRYLQHKTISDLTQQAQSLSSQIENEGLPLRRYFVDLERVHDTRGFIVSYGDKPVQRNSGGPQQVEPTSRPLPFIDWELLNRGDTQVVETNKLEGDQQVIVVAQGFKSGNELAGAVVLAKPLRSLQAWQPLAGWFLLAAAISLAVSFVMAFLLARRISNPLHEITLAASSVAKGDFSRELAVRSEDEIGRLADAFRYMTQEVQKSQEQQRQFVINVSHELKTPLTAISGHAQALREGIAKDPQDVTKSLEVIGAETKRLSRLIEDLLSLAKFDARQFELKKATVSLKQLLPQLAHGFERQAKERNIKLSTAVKITAVKTGSKITTDPDRLRQILANLIQNALTHTPPAGEITISAFPAADALAIAVADSGQGISPEDLPHVFDRFYRSKSSPLEAGLGLGLSISRELARALGGDITVSSQPGHGSTFTLTLPA